MIKGRLLVVVERLVLHRLLVVTYLLTALTGWEFLQMLRPKCNGNTTFSYTVS